jgi:hypothetical protein
VEVTALKYEEAIRVLRSSDVETRSLFLSAVLEGWSPAKFKAVLGRPEGNLGIREVVVDNHRESGAVV